MTIKTAPNLLKYIETYHDWFTIDENNTRLLQALSLYCKGKEEFEKLDDKAFKFKEQSSLYLEKGILLIGNVGTGKTELLKMVNRYMKFLGRTGTQFRVDSIPDIADRFSAKGREAFDSIKKGNWMFDELCFLDEKTGKPDREYAINYGDKILIGSKVVYDRSTIFMEDGWKSHFTTNASLKQLYEIYGERVFSRLIEMCNVFIYSGKDRRPNNRPHMVRDRTKEQIKEVHVTPPKQPEDDFIQAATSPEAIQKSYESYMRTGNYIFIHESEYDLLKIYGKELNDLTDYMVELRAESPMAGDDILEKYAKRKSVAAYYTSASERGEKLLEIVK